MLSPTSKPNTPSLQPALELIYLATLEQEQASQCLRELLLKNPNYFATLTENSFRIVLNINGDTAYESLGCVRYIPLLDQIYASINITRETGYSFHVGKPASCEHIRFYLSDDRGVTWQDKGISSVNVVDQPGGKTRLFLVTRKADLSEKQWMEDTILLRAILSWNSMPPSDQPDWTPLWGNVAETQIRVASRDRLRRSVRTGSGFQFADEPVSMPGLGRHFDRVGVGPVETLSSTGLPQSTAVPSREYQLTAV